MILFFDTETTGFYDKKLPVDHKDQPFLVELGYLLTTDYGEELVCANHIVHACDKDGKTIEIPEQASNVHGITTETMKLCGIPSISALSAFSHLCKLANTVVAHNFLFDFNILNLEYARIDKLYVLRTHTNTICTMQKSTNFCELPGKFGKYKWPKLEELHEKLFSEGFVGAHNALTDVRATVKCYFKLVQVGVIKPN